jgi:hypothetical protein
MLAYGQPSYFIKGENMQTHTHLIVEHGRLLKKNNDEDINVVIYKDRAVVSIKKIFIGKNIKGQRRYRYLVVVNFVYVTTEQTTSLGYPSLKKALNYAEQIFIQRNTYMHVHDLKLKTDNGGI